MRRRARTADRAEEEQSPYGSRYATVEFMPAELLDVGERYMENLKKKALSVSRALQKAGVPHAVIGGLAIAAHVAKVNASAERNTKDLDILLDRADLEMARKALEAEGYRYRKVVRLHAFMPIVGKPKFEDGVHIIWCGEKVREDYLFPAPRLAPDSSYRAGDGVEYLSLKELLTMKLTSFRLKDKVHVQDLLGQKLITKKIELSLPVELQERLRQVKVETERERL